MTENYTKDQIKRQIGLVLKNGQFCHLGMAENNMPYVVTVNFGFDDEYIYFHSSQKGKKMEILKTNPNVCFEVNYGGEIYSNKQACNWGTKFRSIIGTGLAEIILDEDGKKKALQSIMHKYSGTKDHEFNEHVLVHTNLYRISLSNVTTKQNKMYWKD